MTDRPQPQPGLSAAECAARTGLTVRALRVYERYGLITPGRAPNGWRVYGAGDLARLNVIVTLKSLGLTLSKIQEVMNAKSPSLQRVLQIQLQTWQAKQAGAQRGAALVQSALQYLNTHQMLPVDELTTLIRSTTMSDAKTTAPHVIADLSEEERRTWISGWREHSSPTDSKSFAANQNALFGEAQQLVDAGLTRSS
jgi:DNA-binding transcriptional MerR regulator